MKDVIGSFLLNYHSTPHCSTGVPPAELMHHRQLRNRLDCILPNHRKVEREQERGRRQGPTTSRSFEPNTIVYYRNRTGDPPFLRGVIVSKKDLSYEIRGPDGTIDYRHVDHVRRGPEGSVHDNVSDHLDMFKEIPEVPVKGDTLSTGKARNDETQTATPALPATGRKGPRRFPAINPPEKTIETVSAKERERRIFENLEE